MMWTLCVLTVAIVCVGTIPPIKLSIPNCVFCVHLEPFWTSTGLCPTSDDHIAFLLSNDEKMNLALLGSVANQGLTHVRIHWLLNLVTWNASGNYGWNKLDELLDWIRDQGLSVGFELMTSVKILEPRDWINLLEKLLIHYIGKYGRQHVASWRFELMNEPDLKMYNPQNLTLSSYLEYFTACAEGLQRGGLSVGGPAGLFKDPSRHPLCWGLLDHCSASGSCNLSFLSYHAKGDGVTSNVLRKGLALSESWRRRYPQLHTVPLVNDEADPLTGWHNPTLWRAGTEYAVATVQNVIGHMKKLPLKILSEDNAFLSYHPHYFTQRTLLARIQINNTRPHHVQFFKKPVLTAIAMLALLDTQLAYLSYHPDNPGLSCVATQSATRQTVLLAVGYDTLNFSTTTRAWGDVILQMKLKPANGRYQVFHVNNSLSSPFQVWTADGSPDFPSKQLRRRMRQNEGAKVISAGSVTASQHALQLKWSAVTVPSLVLVVVCYDGEPHPGPVSKLRFVKVSVDEVVLLWNDENVISRCLKSYSIEFKGWNDVEFRILAQADPMLLSYQADGLEEEVWGQYRVQAIDLWSRTGPYSNIIVVLYKKEYLGLMVACTWVCGFGALVATWLGLWGQFGLDRQIGSCSILPDHEGRSPKAFLFLVAFVIPCISIIVCYARIFYIVRKTALKSRTRSLNVTKFSESSTTTSRRYLKPKTTSSCEDSAIGTSTTGASDRSSSVYFENVQVKTSSPERPIPNPSFLHKRAYSDSRINVSDGVRLSKQRKSLETSVKKQNISNEEAAKSNPESPVLRNGYEGSPCKVNFDETAHMHLLEPPVLTYGRKKVSEEDLSTRSATPTIYEDRDRRRKKRMPSVNLTAVFRRGSGSPRRSSAMTHVPGKMTAKDKKLLKMILVIFLSFLVCYLPITISKTFRHVLEIHTLNIAGYVLIYLTTCINPIIYVVMSSEYRQAYKNLLTCRSGESGPQNRSGSQK